MISQFYDEDQWRKSILLGMAMNDFRSFTSSIDYTSLDAALYDVVTCLYKVCLSDIPQICIQMNFIKHTQCGIMNPNSIIYISIAMSITSCYITMYKLLLFAY